MKKEIVICDLCRRDVTTTKHDDRDLCTNCLDVYGSMYTQVVKGVEFKVGFSIDHQLMLLEMLQHFNFHYLFKERSEEMRQKFFEALSISREKWER